MKRIGLSATVALLSLAFLTCELGLVSQASAGPRGRRGPARGPSGPGIGSIQPSGNNARIGTLPSAGQPGMGTLKSGGSSASGLGSIGSGSSAQPKSGTLQSRPPGMGTLKSNQGSLSHIRVLQPGTSGQPGIGVLQGQPSIGAMPPGSFAPPAVHAPPRLPGSNGRQGGNRGNNWQPGANGRAPAAGNRQAGAGGGIPPSLQGFLGGMAGSMAGNMAGQIQQRLGNRLQQFQSGPDPFTPAWYKDHPKAWKATHPHAHPRPWAWASAAAVAGWIGLSSQPVVYDYGVYPAETNYTNAATLANHEQRLAALEQMVAAGAKSTSAGPWNQIGVYTLLPPEQTNATVALQLAVDAQGTLRGNYFDLLGNTSQPLVGAIDPHSQRVAWRVESNPNVVYETGLGNLTQPATPVLLHLGTQQTQRWSLVRLEGE